MCKNKQAYLDSSRTYVTTTHDFQAIINLFDKYDRWKDRFCLSLSGHNSHHDVETNPTSFPEISKTFTIFKTCKQLWFGVTLKIEGVNTPSTTVVILVSGLLTQGESSFPPMIQYIFWSCQKNTATSCKQVAEDQWAMLAILGHSWGLCWRSWAVLGAFVFGTGPLLGHMLAVMGTAQTGLRVP